jgi:hypothetical protein
MNTQICQCDNICEQELIGIAITTTAAAAAAAAA